MVHLPSSGGRRQEVPFLRKAPSSAVKGAAFSALAMVQEGGAAAVGGRPRGCVIDVLKGKGRRPPGEGNVTGLLAVIRHSSHKADIVFSL